MKLLPQLPKKRTAVINFIRQKIHHPHDKEAYADHQRRNPEQLKAEGQYIIVFVMQKKRKDAKVKENIKGHDGPGHMSEQIPDLRAGVPGGSFLLLFVRHNAPFHDTAAVQYFIVLRKC